jgi:thymidylate kinase
LRGLFISFESIDGVGKSTQVGLLTQTLQARDYIVVNTKEPGDARSGSLIGSGVRSLLFTDPTTHAMHPGVADMLFLADHIQNAGDIANAVEAGKVVISDRYADSQFAYGAAAARKAPEWTMDTYALNFGIIPDLTILMVARGPHIFVPYPPPTRGMHREEDISWALARANARRGGEAGKQDGKTWNDVEPQRTIQNAYLKYLKPLPRTFVLDIYESSTKEGLASTIEEEVLRRISEPTVSSPLPYLVRDQAVKAA